MALTFTNRLHLPKWLLGSDVPTRAEFNAMMDQLDSVVPIAGVGAASSKQPSDATPDKQFHYDSDTGEMQFMDGFSWQSVGRVMSNPAIVRGVFSGNLLELHDANGNVILTIDPNGRTSYAPGDFTSLVPQLPTDAHAAGGSAAVPGYRMTTEGLVVMQGCIAGTGISGTLSVPRPADHADHRWLIPTGVGDVPASNSSQFAAATLLGATGTLQFYGHINYTWLDSITYLAE